MNRVFLPRWVLLLVVVAAAPFQAFSQQCWVMPGLGNPFHYGLHRVANTPLYSDTSSLQDAVWLQDGRVAAAFSGFSSFAPKRAVIRVYREVSKTIIYDSLIQPPDSADLFSFFGTTLATSGNFLAANFTMTNDTQAVAVFEATNSSSWALRATLQPILPATNDSFGSQMAMSGDWIVVRSPRVSGSVQPGGMYLFKRNTDGDWQRKGFLSLPTFPVGEDLIGQPIALRNDLLALGKLNTTANGLTNKVHLWRLNPVTDEWVFEAALAATGGLGSDSFGSSVALGQDQVFVGATKRSEGASSSGAVYVFRRVNGTWGQESKIVPPVPTSGASFGSALDHSDIGPYLSVTDIKGVLAFHYEGGQWVYGGRNGLGNVFYNWPVDTDTRQTFLYGKTNSRPDRIFQRGHQTLAFINPSLHLLELGWHRIITRPLTNASGYRCYSQPLNYDAIGASSEVPTDGDNDRISDLEEGYFGTLIDPTNTQEGKMKARPGAGGGFVVQWPRAPWTNFPIQVEPQWSSNLVDWSTNGISTQVVGKEPNTDRDLIEANVPGSVGAAAYFRLKFSLPRGPASEAWP